jgi:hypothetical protein
MNPVLETLYQQHEREGVVVEGDVLRFPGMGVGVRPEIAELTDNKAIIYLHVNCDQWDRELFECSAGFGDSQENAIKWALFSFTAGFMREIKIVMRESFGCPEVHCDCGANPQPLTSQYNGHEHRWIAYASDGIGLGKSTGEQPPFWDTVRDGVAARLGNQKIAWVKLYGAKVGDEATGECRINDEAIPALSGQLQGLVQAWEPTEAGSMRSYKQFIFLVQEDDTRRPYPYTMAQIQAHTRTALRMFSGFDDRDRWADAVGKAIGDKDLAAEICAYVPELCAQNSFADIEYGESVVVRAAGWEREVYLTQLPAYYAVKAALYDAFRSGDVTNEMYRDFIGLSSIWSVICTAKEQGADITQPGCKISLVYGFDDDYVLR